MRAFFMYTYYRFVFALTCLAPCFICKFYSLFKNKNKKYLYLLFVSQRESSNVVICFKLCPEH